MQPQNNTSGAGFRILVVEDDADILRILTHMLRNVGYEVTQATGGEEALRLVRSCKPDIVLTDLAMPGVSGVEVIHQVKRDPLTRHIPCLAVTAHVWDSVARVAESVGCDGFVFKPFNNRQLLKELQRHLERATPDGQTAGESKV